MVQFLAIHIFFQKFWIQVKISDTVKNLFLKTDSLFLLSIPKWWKYYPYFTLTVWFIMCAVGSYKLKLGIKKWDHILR